MRVQTITSACYNNYNYVLHTHTSDVVSDTNSPLGAEGNAEREVSADAVTVTMLKSYQQSDICRKNDQQLQLAMQHGKEHSRGGRERDNPASYATHFLWQV